MKIPLYELETWNTKNYYMPQGACLIIKIINVHSLLTITKNIKPSVWNMVSGIF